MPLTILSTESSNDTPQKKCRKKLKRKPHVGIQVEEQRLDMEPDIFWDDVEVEEAENAKKEELRQSKCGYTGMFKDGVRRADYVLVLTESDGPEVHPYKMKFLIALVRLGLQLEFQRGVDKSWVEKYESPSYSIRFPADNVLELTESDGPKVHPYEMKFLIALIRLGLQLEFHRGVLPTHKDLIFVLIHITDRLLDEFPEPLAIKKYFKDTHVQHIGAHQSWDEKLFSLENEKEWVKKVRENYIRPMKYSNYERSMIVYSLLRHMPFDPTRSYFGMQRLLDQRIILDAYALHDGPYFFTNTQVMAQVNARQILYYSWIGLENAFMYQPKNLIQEYFGPKIGFFFVFFEFYNKFLLILSVAGIVTFLLQVFLGNSKISAFYDKTVCKNNQTYCQECNNEWSKCYSTKFSDYCAQVKWASLYDNVYTIAYSGFVLLWASIFYVYWRRQEMYYMWIWEQKYRGVEKSPRIIRPEYQVNYGQLSGRDTDGRWSQEEKSPYRFLSYAARVVPAVMILLVFKDVYAKYITLHVDWLPVFGDTRPRPHDIEDSVLTSEYSITATHKVLAFLTALFYLILFGLEMLGRLLVRAGLTVENNRLQSAHERRQAAQLFTLSCLACLPIPLYYGWVKGLFYTYPRYVLLNKCVHLCGYYCTDVLAMVVIILTVLRIVLWKALRFWSSCWKSDFIKFGGKYVVVPSWEREYGLNPVTDAQIVEYYNEIVLQFTMIVLLSVWFPLMPLIAFLVNWCDIKYKASLLLMYSRRPTVFPTDGIMQWNNIIRGVIVLIPILHALSLVQNLKMEMLNVYSLFGSTLQYTRLFDRRELNVDIRDKYGGNDSLGLQYNGSGEGYKHYPKTAPEKFPFQRPLILYTDSVDFAPDMTTFYRIMYDVVFIVGYSITGIITLLVILYFFRMEIPWVIRFMQIEKALKRLYVVSRIKIPKANIPTLDKMKTADENKEQENENVNEK